MAFDLKEAILDDILGDNHVGLTILYCSKNISTIMIILEMAFNSNNYGRILVERVLILM